MAIDIIYEDDTVLVVNKPAGIAVQTAGVGAKSIETECKKYRKQKGEAPEIYIVHRLDLPVSGILLLAKTKEAAGFLSKDMQAEAFSKDYKATVLKTRDIPRTGKLIDYLVKDGKTNSSKIADAKEKDAKRAELDYEVISESENTYELLIHLHTGRHHQIRVQLSNMGVPIIGDRKYGSVESITYADKNEIKNVLLTAYHLSFRHPKTKKTMDFKL